MPKRIASYISATWLEEGLIHNDLRPAYAAARRVNWVPLQCPPSYHGPKKDGSPCNSQKELLARWTEHYSEVMNNPAAASCPELDTQQLQATNDPEIPVDAPTLDEIRAAVKKLNLGRAAGNDAIPPEMLKLAIDPTCRVFHQVLLANVWNTYGYKVPSAWKEGIIISLYKGKDPRNECASYRSISLLSVPGKVSRSMRGILEPW